MQRQDEVFVKLTPKQKTIVAQVGEVALTATVYSMEPVGRREAGALRIMNPPALPSSYSTKSIFAKFRRKVKRAKDNFANRTRRRKR